MALILREPRFGYDYPLNAVLLPTPVVGKIDPVDPPAQTGLQMLGLGYQLDGGDVLNINIPPAFQYGIPQIDPFVPPPPLPAWHQISILAFYMTVDPVTSVITTGFEVQTWDFQHTGSAETPFQVIQPVRATPPEFRVEISQEGESSSSPGGLIHRRLKIKPINPNAGKPMGIAVLPPTQAKVVQRGHRQLVMNWPDAEEKIFEVVSPNRPGNFNLVLLVWDQETLEREARKPRAERQNMAKFTKRIQYTFRN